MDSYNEPIIKPDLEAHVCLPITSSNEPFPGKIYAHTIWHNTYITDNIVMYIPQILSNAIVVMSDDDNVVGHCICSNCKKNINFVDKYCRHCGAQLNYKQN